MARPSLALPLAAAAAAAMGDECRFAVRIVDLDWEMVRRLRTDQLLELQCWLSALRPTRGACA